MSIVLRKQVVIILLLFSFLFWIICIKNTYIPDHLPSSLSYAHQLSNYYYYGSFILAFMIIVSFYFVNEPIRLKTQVLVCILTSYVFVTPLLIYSNPRIIDVYLYAYRQINYMLSNSFLPAYTWQEMSMYWVYINDFPVATIFFASAVELSGMKLISFAKYYPLILICILLFTLYSTAYLILGNKVTTLFAPVAYVSLTIFPEYNLAAQSYTMLMGSVFILLLIDIAMNTNGGIGKKKFILIIIWISILTSHPYTSIIYLFSIFVLFIICETVLMLYKRKINLADNIADINKIRYIFSRLLPLLFITILTYLIFKSGFVLSKFIIQLNNIFIDISRGDLVHTQAHAVLNPSESYILLVQLRWVLIICVLALSTICLFILIYNKCLDGPTLLIGALFIGFMLFAAILVISGESGARFGPNRGFIFGLFCCVILFSIFLDKKFAFRYNIIKLSIILFIAVSFLSIPITRYGGDPYNYMSSSEISGINFVFQNPEIGLNIIDFGIPWSIYIDTNYWRNSIKMKQPENFRLYENKSSDMNKIFDSGNCKIFKDVNSRSHES